MATFNLTVGSIISGASWAGATVANISTVNGVGASTTTEGATLKLGLNSPVLPNAVDKTAVGRIYVTCKGSVAGLKIKAHLYEGASLVGSWASTQTVSSPGFTTLSATVALDPSMNENNLRIWLVVSSMTGTVTVDNAYAEFTALSIPARPTSVSATDGTLDDHIRISWTQKPGADAYKIYRNTTNSFGTAQYILDAAASPQGNYLTPPDAYPPSPGVVYWYWVTSVNGAGESSPSSSDSGFIELPSVSVTPAQLTFGLETSVDIADPPPDTITPEPISFGLRTKSPFRLEDTDVDGFFQSLCQQHAYTNYGYRQRDTFFAVDQANNTVTWLYPTASSETFVKQLPRVLLAINAQTGQIGLGYPLPLDQDGKHTPLKTKNFFGLLTSGAYPWRRRQTSILAIGARYGTYDDTIIDSEILEKDLYTMNMQSFSGINTSYADASVYTKFFRPPTKKPNTKTRITKIKPIFSHGDASSLEMHGHLWTVSEYTHDDNLLAFSPTTTSDLILDGSVIMFVDSVPGVEHCIGISFDTDGGGTTWPIVNGYTGGGIVGLEIEYTEHEVGFI
jgi:hypothetical protein